MSTRSQATLLMTASTERAALICIDALNAVQQPRCSPLSSVMTMANTLESSRQAWVIRGQSRARRAVSWPAWFARNTGEKPLLYLHTAASSAQLRALSSEVRQRAILCNDSKSRASPSLPLWLASNPLCTPYDPASGEEARAIVLAGLQALYVEGQPGFYYLALHDQNDGPGLSPLDREDALKGMYRVRRAYTSELRVHLLGAGRAFDEVVHAAQLLETDWKVEVQLWSCPSYTRLAREAQAAQRWNRLHPLLAKRSCHLRQCLAGAGTPVIAVTGYPQPIVDQLAGHVDGRFVALGAGSVEASAPSRYWIATLALKALADDGRIDAEQVETALHRYHLK
ncbi:MULTISPECIES: pyruvate dehydrogenase [unclassified Pseudomonas]|uniref:transketolase-like TK C-terminal-containing protein n=1 Tax=unclassified Pseudomonas TaxID=196821 RepID=UPI0015A339B5|nr:MULTISPECIES: pyruvate dehydrogenase [unclassified Pseudomonas]NWC95074.1 pyruvate dehydrogenase [Pseudomonas sp. IPO3779]NWD19973.1 pyruvate dehydrogenase [Pseudomonas sp. IPO3778]